MRIENRQNNVKVSLPKEFAIKEAAEFREQVYELINKGSYNFEIDFSECVFIDSSGLGVMVSAYKRCAEKGGKIQIANLNPQVKKVFQLTRLDRVFEMN